MDDAHKDKNLKNADDATSHATPPPTSDSIDDVEIELYDDDTARGSASPEARVKRLKERLDACVKEKQTYLDGWQRAKADFANLKKREEEGKGEFLKFAQEGLITDLIPVLESFHMAFANKEAWGKVDVGWRKGVEHIHAQLLQILSGYGVMPVDPNGATFDPKEHTAIGTVETDDKGQYHKVAEVLQLGYRLNGKLIRSPRVKVYGAKGEDATLASREG